MQLFHPYCGLHHLLQLYFTGKEPCCPMQRLRNLLTQARGCSDYSKLALYLGLVCWVVLWTAGLVFLYFAQIPSLYLWALQQFRGAVETGPACFAAAFCAAVLCDMMERKAAKPK